MERENGDGGVISYTNKSTTRRFTNNALFGKK